MLTGINFEVVAAVFNVFYEFEMATKSKKPFCEEWLLKL